jgi:hypothetical protein
VKEYCSNADDDPIFPICNIQSSGTRRLSHFPADNQLPRTDQTRNLPKISGSFDFPQYGLIRPLDLVGFDVLEQRMGKDPVDIFNENRKFDRRQDA